MLDESIIIQVDATVIAGILILLTISSFKFEGMDETILQKLGKKGKLSTYLVVFILTMPFSASVLCLVIMDFTNVFYPQTVLVNGKVPLLLFFAELLTGMGFAYVLAVVYKITTAEEKISELEKPEKPKRSLLDRIKDYFCRK
jgi:hypothetical protein